MSEPPQLYGCTAAVRLWPMHQSAILPLQGFDRSPAKSACKNFPSDSTADCGGADAY
eukprot:SAG25_NODE_12429_length_280_cov_0.701657_1_plen_56_part_10